MRSSTERRSCRCSEVTDVLARPISKGLSGGLHVQGPKRLSGHDGEAAAFALRCGAYPPDEWEYIAPELLPKWSEAQEQLLGRLRDDPPDSEPSARYAFLQDIAFHSTARASASITARLVSASSASEPSEIVRQDNLKQLDRPTSTAIEIQEFVNESQIPTLYFE
jgi:hypothetical protein